MSAPKISIIGQIAEVERELAMRTSVYPRQVAQGKMRQGEADLLIGRMEAVLHTLQFCANNERDIRAFIAAKREASTS